MSEIYPSVRTSIRHSVLQALYERPGAWLSTHELLDLVEEAESSGILARILSDMAATGRLAKGPKTQNANGQACNTWGLSPEWRGRLAVEHTWQDHTGQAAAAPPLPVESREDEAPIPPDPAPAFTLWADASAAVAAALPFISGATSKTTPSIQETEIPWASLAMLVAVLLLGVSAPPVAPVLAVADHYGLDRAGILARLQDKGDWLNAWASALVPRASGQLVPLRP